MALADRLRRETLLSTAHEPVELLPHNMWLPCTRGVGRPLTLPGGAIVVVHFKAKPPKLARITVTALSGAYGNPPPAAICGLGDTAALFPFPATAAEFAQTLRFVRGLLQEGTFSKTSPTELEAARHNLLLFHEAMQSFLVGQLGPAMEPYGSAGAPHPHPCALHLWGVCMFIYFHVLGRAFGERRDPTQLLPLLRETLALAASQQLLTRDPKAIPPTRMLTMIQAMGFTCGACGKWGGLDSLCTTCDRYTLGGGRSSTGGDQYVRSATERAAALATFKADPRHPDRAKMAAKDLATAFNKDPMSAPFREKKPSGGGKRAGSAGKMSEAEALAVLVAKQSGVPRPVAGFPITYK